MNDWLMAFVDESGTNELDSDKPGVSHLFISVAVLVDEATVLAAETAMRQISKTLCGGAEISSKRIGGNNPRRLKHLEAVQNLPFRYLALVINKDRLPAESGMRFKRPFYKFANRMLYEYLARSGKNLRITADEIGGKDFMDSFGRYLNERRFPSLYQKFESSFAKSSATPLIQLADLIAGSLSYCFDPRKRNDYSAQFRELLRPREIAIKCWPWERAGVSGYTAAATLDDRISKTLLSRTTQFLDNHESSSDIDRRMQFNTLSDLYFARQFEVRAKQAIVADVLMDRLCNAGFEQLSKQAFQSRVIGKIRDEGIILAGSSDGYRLALTTDDIDDYLSHDGSIIEPMLDRLLKARETVKFDASGHDILSAKRFACLKELADTFQNFKVGSGVAGTDHVL